MIKDKTLENEANLFACLLLMPKKFIAKDVEEGFDLSDDTRLKELAKKYDVTLTAIAFRIAYYLEHKQ